MPDPWRDSRAYVLAIVTLIAVALIATVLPARRAASIDPTEALRSEEKSFQTGFVVPASAGSGVARATRDRNRSDRHPSRRVDHLDCWIVTVCSATVIVPVRFFGFPTYCATV